MTKFQGSGFEIDVPESCIDSSVYTFVLPTEQQFTPYVTVRFEVVEKIDLKEYLTTKRNLLSDEVEDLEVIKEAFGKRGEWDVGLTEYEWGSGPARVFQKQVCFLVTGSKNKVYVLTATDVADNKEYSKAAFDQLLKTFTPNNIQVLGV